jgi:Transposase DDE domain
LQKIKIGGPILGIEAKKRNTAMHSVRLNQSYQDLKISQCPKYVDGLLACSTRKVCTNIADCLNESHDVVYREMSDYAGSDNTNAQLREIATSVLNQKNIYLILDDTKLPKIHAQEIEGLEVSRDGSSGQNLLGLSMITCLISDGTHQIPVEALPYVSKELAGATYQTKTELGQIITKSVKSHFSIKRLLADAHYSTKQNIPWLHEQQTAYLMKFARHKKVTIGGKCDQLQKLLRLQKNSRTACIRGEFEEVPCYFYVIKIEDGSTIYLISNDLIPLNEVLALYRIRWKIELFHRTAKQKFGLRECQMLSMEKQRQHVLFVMHAYAIAECIRNKEKIDSVDEWVKTYRS